MNRTRTLVTLAVASAASLARADNKPVAPAANANAGSMSPVAFESDYDFSGKALLANPSLLKEIDDTLIRAGGCRTMATLGYGNGYQCPASGLTACLTMLKDGKVDACAALTGRDYPTGCAAKEAASAEARATSTCADLSVDLWKTLAIKAPYASVKNRLERFGCKAEAGVTMFCPSHLREWLCQPFERGGVVVCRPPTIVKQCSGGEFPSCWSVET